MAKQTKLKNVLSFVIFMMGMHTAIGQSLFVQEGQASFYADKFEGRPTASGEKYKHNKLTAAHKTLPFGTVVRVTNLKNNKSVEVKINDRGPFVPSRIIDLSKTAAEKLDFINQGIALVKIEVINDVNTGQTSYNTGKPNMKDPDIDEKEFYEFSVSRLIPSGYGVQIGTFQEMVNLVRLSDNLKKSYRKKVTVQVSILNAVKVYKIIIGRESNRKKAEGLKQKLVKKYPDCFVVDFQKL